MNTPLSSWILCIAFALAPSVGAGGDWLQWRGPSGDNHAAEGTSVPVTWSTSEHVIWKTPLPGRGHATPIIVGNRIFISTADEKQQTQSVLVLDRESGKSIHQWIVHQGGLALKIHTKNTHASPTLASDGRQLFAVYSNDRRVWATAYALGSTLDVDAIWQREVAGFEPEKYQFGYAPSPILFENQLIVSSEYDGPESGIYALDVQSGKQLWKVTRKSQISFSTPIVARIDGRDQMLISGMNHVQSYDPRSGEPLWQSQATTAATCGTLVWDKQRVFASGGYPDSGTYAIMADGSGKVAWENGVKCYEQSMLVSDGHVYAVADSGVAYCWRATDGQEMWKKRLQGPVSASPLLVGDTIYASNESGTTFVFRANPNEFESLAENRLGDSSFASPIAVDNRLYLRHAVDENGQLQEYLFCIGQ